MINPPDCGSIPCMAYKKAVRELDEAKTNADLHAEIARRLQEENTELRARITEQEQENDVISKKLAREFQRNQSFENVRQMLYKAIKEKDTKIDRLLSIEGNPYTHLKLTNALRAENARLRQALEEIEKINITPVHQAVKRFVSELLNRNIAKAALQPQEQEKSCETCAMFPCQKNNTGMDVICFMNDLKNWQPGRGVKDER